jgi:lipopolysaccharide transport system permease protein
MEIILEPGRSEKNYWRDIWNYRELFQVLAWRDLSLRYKQTIIDILWASVRPVLTMVVFTVIFGKLAKMPSPSDIFKDAPFGSFLKAPPFFT